MKAWRKLATLCLPWLAAVVWSSDFTLLRSDVKGMELLWQGRSESQISFALPPGGEADLRYEILEAYPDLSEAKSNRRRPEVPAQLSESVRFRDVEMATVRVFPVYNHQGKAMRLGAVRLTVTFRGGGRSRTVFAAPENHPSEVYLREALVNYPVSRGFRSLPALPAAKIAAEPNLPAVRLLVRTQGVGIHVLTTEDLRKAGVPLGKIDPRRFRLFHTGKEIPIYLSGEDDGRWHEGDYLEFIGKRAEGEFTYNSLYTANSVFTLVWDMPGFGLRAPRVPVAVREGGNIRVDVPAAESVRPHRVDMRVENDFTVLRIGSTNAEDIPDLGQNVIPEEMEDFWFWQSLGQNKDLTEVDFHVPYHSADTRNRPLTARDQLFITIGLKGVTNHLQADPDHHIKFSLNGNDISLVGGQANDAIWEGQSSYLWKSQPLSPTLLQPGKNTLLFQNVNDLFTNDGTPVENQVALLNFVTLSFPAGFQAVDNRLRFSNRFPDSLGSRIFTVGGFTSDKISLWDESGRKLVGFDVFSGGGAPSVSFRDSLITETYYQIATWENRMRPVVTLDTLDNLKNGDNEADYLIVTHKSLLGSALDSLVAHRKSQGMRVRVALVEHIYQTFGDGSPHPAAIRRFVQHAYLNWKRPAPAYLLLAGNASMLFDKQASHSHPNLVPTSVVNIPGWGIAAADDYFAKVSGEDDVPDLFVGRIPAVDRNSLSTVVQKTLVHEKERPAGHWRNKTLLLGGYEDSFTRLNNSLQTLLIDKGADYSRLDLFPTSPYFRKPDAPPGFFQQMDSAFNLVSFVGHGGGAVWSDGGLLTIQALDEGRLRGDFPIPMVLSLTCLTGFFEDVNARSLGEEMLLLKNSGAAAFYGAAGYISNAATEELAHELLTAAYDRPATTAGELIHRGEALVRLKTGNAFLPVLAEFNLLGDPALRLAFADVAPPLQITPSIGAGKKSIRVSADKLPLTTGSGRLSYYRNDSLLQTVNVAVRDGAFSHDKEMPEAGDFFLRGKAVLHAWNETSSYRSEGEFSLLDWLADSIFTVPANPRVGDSVKVGFRVRTLHPGVALVGGVALHAVGDRFNSFPAGNQVPLQISEDGRTVITDRAFALLPQASGANAPILTLRFRMALRALDGNGTPGPLVGGIETRLFHTPLPYSPDLALASPPFRLPIQNDLGVWVRFGNRGLGADSNFTVHFKVAGEGNRVDTLKFGRKLSPGRVDSLFIPLRDEELDKRLTAVVIPTVPDATPADNVRDTLFTWKSSMLLPGAREHPILEAPQVLTLPPNASDSVRVFTRLDTSAGLPAHLFPVADNPASLEVRVAGPLPNLRLAFSSTAQAFSGSLPTPAWHFRESRTGRWTLLDSPAKDSLTREARYVKEGYYRPLHNTDITPPEAGVTSGGHRLLPDDYVPLKTPIEIVLRDDAGIDGLLHPPRITSQRQNFDTTNSAVETGFDAAGLMRIRFWPDPSIRRDSVEITAHDISGNQLRQSFTYRLGTKLSILNLGSYPNPFADTAVFVYTLTEFSQSVSLRVYTRSGRLVRALEDRNAIGYRETVWDGRTGDGREVANGLYYLKVTAQAGGREASQIYKLFKKKRK